MANKELLKKQAELARVTGARMEMQIKELDLLESLERLRGDVATQLAKEAELSELISTMQKETEK